jgi:hypothetical protein
MEERDPTDQCARLHAADVVATINALGRCNPKAPIRV